MRAIVQHQYGSPDLLRVEEIDRPTIGDKDVLVRVLASSVNPADLAVVTGLPALVRTASGLRRPRKQVPGRDLAGVIEEVGSAVTGLRPGQEVYGEAGQSFAEYTVARPAQLAPKPANLSFTEAAAVPLAGLTAWQALEKVSISPGQRVLVTGASGGVGHFALQIARARGAEVTAVCSGRNAEMVTGLGADHVIDYQQSDFTTLGQHYDVIVDVVVTHALADARRALTPTGGVPVGRDLTRFGTGGGRAARPHARHRRCRAQVPDDPPATSGGRVSQAEPRDPRPHRAHRVRSRHPVHRAHLPAG